MPYKIYTYADPYNLDKADFWNEISSLPHFCGARTLVNGLKDVLGDSIKGLVCNLDALINHDDIDKSWTGNIGLRLQQYSALSSYFKRVLDSGKLKKLKTSPLGAADFTANDNRFVHVFLVLEMFDEAVSEVKKEFYSISEDDA
mgnify:CR=1 FL=1